MCPSSHTDTEAEYVFLLFKRASPKNNYITKLTTEEFFFEHCTELVQQKELTKLSETAAYS